MTGRLLLLLYRRCLRGENIKIRMRRGKKDERDNGHSYVIYPALAADRELAWSGDLDLERVRSEPEAEHSFFSYFRLSKQPASVQGYPSLSSCCCYLRARDKRLLNARCIDTGRNRASHIQEQDRARQDRTDMDGWEKTLWRSITYYNMSREHYPS